ncbi:hypothetical protein Trydic_g10099 [Trypoxylus dichotomus]
MRVLPLLGLIIFIAASNGYPSSSERSAKSPENLSFLGILKDLLMAFATAMQALEEKMLSCLETAGLSKEEMLNMTTMTTEQRNAEPRLQNFISCVEAKLK